jgi:hypothetical protein
MGANLIRAVCAPRDPAFYNACDELGMLSTVDVPTWGTTTSQYPDSFWIRENNVVKEMIEVGYNHPSILLWGLFNEPLNDYTDPTQIPLLNATAHAEDDTRMTYMANNRKNTSLVFQTDVVGLNYGNRIDPPYNNVKARIFATEYHEGWLDWCMRGSASDIETGAGSYAQTRWNIWQNFKDHRETNLMAGAVMWCHNDYNSQFLDQDKEMGCVDFYRIPKCVFYWFRTQWTGKASDSPISGLTPAKLQLDYDLDSLIADSTDFTVITASIRDASGKCVRTALPVTFNVSGPADYFGPLNLTTVAGKIALIVKAKNRTGALTISATTPSLPAATPVTVRLVPPDQYDSSAYSFITPVTWTPHVQEQSMVSIKQYGRQLRIGFPNRGNKQNSVSIINLQGRSVNCPVVYSGNRATVFAQQLAPGFYYLSIKAGSDSRNIVRRVFFGN